MLSIAFAFVQVKGVKVYRFEKSYWIIAAQQNKRVAFKEIQNEKRK